MALIKCKQCSNDVATNAKTCPKCGAPVASGVSVFRIILGVCVFFCFTGVCVAVGGSQNASGPQSAQASAPKPSQEAALNTGIRALLSEYKDNEVRADRAPG